MLRSPVVDRSKKTRLGTPAPPSKKPSGQRRGDRAPSETENLDAFLDERLAEYMPEADATPATPAAPAARAAQQDVYMPLGTNTPAAGMPAYVPPPDPYIGTTIAGRYRVDQKLGEGGMGGVYLATHVTLEKQVALKILHAGFVRKPEIVERFLQEAKAASRIRHENVIDITDFGATPEGTVFFAMEVLEGLDLHDVITRASLQGQRLPWERSRGIFLQICAALSAAHAKGVVHRDLKPENIYLVKWLGHDDFVKLLDFGIAKLTEVSGSERKLTRTGMLFGTPEYMSPEQARGDSVDHRVDIYALGCILHQLITGRVPFESDNFMSILSQHLAEPPAPIAGADLAAVGAPSGINEIMLKALAKDRDERYFSADEMAAAIMALDHQSAGQAGAGAAMARRLTFSGPPPAVAAPPGPGNERLAAAQDAGAHAAAPLAHAEIASAVGAGGTRKGSRLGWLAAVVIVAGLAVGGAALWLEDRRAHRAAADTSGQPTPGAPAAGAELPARVTLRLDSTPGKAAVYDDSGALLGHTPLEYAMPGSADSRRFRFELDGYRNKVLEVIPTADIDESVELQAAGEAENQAAGEAENQAAGEAENQAAGEAENQAADDAETRTAKRGDRRRGDRARRRSSGDSRGDDTAEAETETETETKAETDTSPTGDPVIKNPFAK